MKENSESIVKSREVLKRYTEQSENQICFFDTSDACFINTKYFFNYNTNLQFQG